MMNEFILKFALCAIALAGIAGLIVAYLSERKSSVRQAQEDC